MTGRPHASPIFILFALCGIAFVTAATAAAAPQAAGQTLPALREAQVLDRERTGVHRPAGLAYSPTAGAFYVVGASRAGPAAGISAFDLVRGSRAAGRAGTSVSVRDPVNTAFDARGGRLLFLGDGNRLFELRARPDGTLERATAVTRPGLRLPVSDPQGLAVDPRSGAVFVLDADGPRLVRIEYGRLSEIDLSGSGITDARGLAFDPARGRLHLRGGEAVYELTTSGKVVATRDLSGVDLVAPGGMAVAPTSDLTDDPSEQSLYIADRGGDRGPSSGGITELRLQQVAQAEALDFTSSLVRTTNTGAWNPPSPDPSGIAYVPTSNRLIIVDGEVEETVGGITHFQGANVWETTLAGSVQRSANISKKEPTDVPMTDEPTGIAFKPGSGGAARYFVSSDAAKSVFTVNAGGDGLIGTSDDTWTSFRTDGVGNTDPEGIAYDDQRDRLFVADGVNAEIYEYTLGGSLVAHFDVQRYGVGDPETVEYDRESGNLFILSNRQSGPIVVETTTSGALIQTIDLSAFRTAGGLKPAGLAIAPASNGSGDPRFYVVDRAVDNDTDPRAVDGKLFEFTAPSGGPPPPPGNEAPAVSAGPDQTITLPSSASLNGTVTDDGLPDPPGTTSSSWSKVSGPGTVTFGNAGAVDTTASFSQAGTYVLRLTASDGALSSSDDVQITVNPSGGGSDLIFADGFESGSFSAWSSAATDGGDLSVTSSAARFGGFGMQATIDDSKAIYVTDTSPAAEPRYRVRFYFNPNSLPMASGDNFLIANAVSGGSTVVMRLTLRWSGSAYQLRTGIRTDGGAFTSSPWISVNGAGWSAIELDWRASTGAGANDGGVTLWVDGVQRHNTTGIDNDTHRIDLARLGVVSGVDTATRGTIYFDAFESRRQTYIGP